MSDPYLSVVIPAFNEEFRLASSLRSIITYLISRDLQFEILVVDDGSRDRTADVAGLFLPEQTLDWRILVLENIENRGKGYSVRRGMLECRGRYALLTDADLSTPISELPKLEACVMEGICDIALGSRDLSESRVEVRQSRFRESSGKLFNRIMRLLVGLPFRDTQCGFKLFDMKRCRALFEHQTIEGFGFDVEILFVARKWGLKAREVPVVWRHAAGSKVRFFPHAFLMLAELFRIRWNELAGKYRTPVGLLERNEA